MFKNISKAQAPFLRIFQPARQSFSAGVPQLVIAIAVGLYSIYLQIDRLNKGLNTLDESYYSLFLHQFDKLGISGTLDRTVHQLTAVVIYPIIKVYWAITGSRDGSMLFLRAIYVAFTLIGTLCLFILLTNRNKNEKPLWHPAIFGAVTYFGFVPFGVQALSYNTLPIFLIIALAYVACLCRLGFLSRTLSGVCGSICIYVSPQIGLVVVGIWIFQIYRNRRSTASLVTHVFHITVCFVLVSIAFVRVVSLTKLFEIVEFQRSYSSFGNLPQRLQPAMNLLNDDATLALILVVTVLQRALFARKFASFSNFLVVLAVAITTTHAKHLIFPPHEIVLVVASASFWRVFSRSSWKHSPNRGLLVSVSLAIGILFGLATQNNPLFNFSSGLILAAAVTITDICDSRIVRTSIFGVLVTSACLLLLLSYSRQSIAAADSQEPYSYEVESGWFAGIRSAPSYESLQRSIVQEVSSRIQGESLAYFGDHFGFLLDVSFKNYVPQSYPLLRGHRYQNPTSLDAISAGTKFYSDELHRPRFVIIENGALNPIGFQFFCLYSKQEELVVQDGITLAIFTRDSGIRVCPS